MSTYGSHIEPRMLSFNFYLFKNKTIICIVYLNRENASPASPNYIATRSVWWTADAGCWAIPSDYPWAFDVGTIRLFNSTEKEEAKRVSFLVFLSTSNAQYYKRNPYKVSKGNKHIGDQSWNTNWTILQQKDAITAVKRKKEKRNKLCPSYVGKTLRCARNI